MVVAYGTFVLKVHTAFSLKEKRMVTKSIVAKVRNKFNASCSETGLNDNIKDIEISVAVVNSSKVVAEKEINNIAEFIYNNPDAELIQESSEIIYI